MSAGPWLGMRPPQHIFARREFLGIALEPPDHEPGSWMGAGKALLDPGGAGILLTARPRVAGGGRRGYEAAIYRSADGLRFEKLGAITKEEAASACGIGIFSIEGTQLVMDPATGAWNFYLSVDAGDSFIWGGLHWRTLQFSATSLAGPWSYRAVALDNDRPWDRLQARDSTIDIVDGMWVCLYKAMDEHRMVRPALATSTDGIAWRKLGPLTLDGEARRAFLNGSFAISSQGPVFLGLESSQEDTQVRKEGVAYADNHSVGHGGSDTYGVAYLLDRQGLNLECIHRQYWEPRSPYEHAQYPLLGYSSVVHDPRAGRYLLYVEAIDAKLTRAIGLNETVERVLVYQSPD